MFLRTPASGLLFFAASKANFAIISTVSSRYLGLQFDHMNKKLSK